MWLTSLVLPITTIRNINVGRDDDNNDENNDGNIKSDNDSNDSTIL